MHLLYAHCKYIMRLTVALSQQLLLSLFHLVGSLIRVCIGRLIQMLEN